MADEPTPATPAPVPSAFPVRGYLADASGALTGEVVYDNGMDLRDYFAAAALPECLKKNWPMYCLNETVSAYAADDAYLLADAMMARREKH